MPFSVISEKKMPVFEEKKKHPFSVQKKNACVLLLRFGREPVSGLHRRIRGQLLAVHDGG